MNRFAGLVVVAAFCLVPAALGNDRPNILWITSEDNGPHLGCYGDTYANTPHIDRLAARGVIYTNAWSNAPVCAPARTTIITGVYPTSLGAEHMRSMVPLPPSMKLYPQYLREAGYYCTNNSKEDYNVAKPVGTWDESNGRAHWRDRRPDQPFFAIFNFTTTHESQIRTRPHNAVHDPAKVRVPPYHPDTPEVRQDWAQYHDKITAMDSQVGRVLDELKTDGLEEETIIFYYGDHGAGMPRSKRWPYHSGLHVPMVVHVPEKYRHLAPEGYAPGGEIDRLVSFVDLAPTVLSLAGIEPPDHMRGHAFMGPFETPRPDYMFGFRGRMDERLDCVRTVQNGRWQYIRNFMPHKIYGQYIAYMFETPTTRVWQRMYAEGKLTPPQTFFWEPKPTEELYDLATDPDQVNNLADDPAYAEVRNELRKVLLDHMLSIRDLGLLPECILHERAGDRSPYAMARDAGGWNDDLVEIASAAADRDPQRVGEMISLLRNHTDPACRYWAATGLLIRGPDAVTEGRAALLAALEDDSAAVQIAAAEALGCYGSDTDAEQSVGVLVQHVNPVESGVYRAIAALNALDAMPLERIASTRARIQSIPTQDPKADGRLASYCARLKERILSKIGDLEQP